MYKQYKYINDISLYNQYINDISMYRVFLATGLSEHLCTLSQLSVQEHPQLHRRLLLGLAHGRSAPVDDNDIVSRAYRHSAVTRGLTIATSVEDANLEKRTNNNVTVVTSNGGVMFSGGDNLISNRDHLIKWPFMLR